MAKAVLDTTVLVSALLNLNPGGVSYELLRFTKQGTFDLYISDEILEETAETSRYPRLRDRYAYSDADIVAYCQDLARFATVVSDVPEVRGIVRDPSDDKIIACAAAAGADYLVTRDKDLLTLREYEGIAIISPEAFLHVLRAQT
jgi:putative PIN family toxin of toxin-antitoxin system